MKKRKAKVVNASGRAIEITQPDKVIFAEAAITKDALVTYYQKISPIMLPYLIDRPLTMHRFPHGIHDHGFYHKDLPDYFPKWIAHAVVAKKTGGKVRYVLCNDEATLVYLANQYCITPHIWLSKVDKLEYPDRMIFDLDPSGKASFTLVKWAAKEIKKVLEGLGLPVFVMTTGSKGLHLVVPIKRNHTFDEVRALARSIAQDLVDQYPKKLTMEMRKENRGNCIFIDTLRNSMGATAVAPYAVRARTGAPIATPITWQELSVLKTAQKYTVKNIFRRLSAKGDVWKDMAKSAVSLSKLIKS